MCVAAQNQVELMIPSSKDLPSIQLTVLVIDDNPQFRQLISDFLAFAGYTVISAVSAIEALTILHQNAPLPSLIITDIIMAHMNGCEFLRVVRDQWKNIPVIMISTSVSFETSCPDILLKPEAYLAKPFSYEELIRTIQATLTSDNVG
jgi:CheY-like chemotaxis protein